MRRPDAGAESPDDDYRSRMRGDALVVDDDSDGRDALAEFLEAQGYAVRQAENGRVALAMIAERQPALMLLDLEMPIMSGWEVLAWAEGQSPCCTIVVVVLSATASPPSDVTFVRKPCCVDDLLTAIRSATAAARRADAPGADRPPQA